MTQSTFTVLVQHSISILDVLEFKVSHGGNGNNSSFEKQMQHTDKKENQIFLIYKEIQSGAVAKSYMTNGLLIYGEIFAHFLIYSIRKPFLIYDFATAPLRISLYMRII